MIFGDYDTIDEWGLFCTGVEISAPEVQRYTLEIPGRQGVLDLTNAMFDGEPRYYNREGKFTFAAPGHAPQDWHDFLSDIRGKLHGQTLQIILEDDPDWYYTGMVEVDADEDEGELEITADMEPFKLAVDETVYEVTSSQTVVLTNDRMKAIPTVTVTDETTITIDGSSVSLSDGTYEMTDFPLYEGDTTWEIETDGTVTITYRQGRL